MVSLNTPHMHVPSLMPTNSPRDSILLLFMAILTFTSSGGLTDAVCTPVMQTPVFPCHSALIGLDTTHGLAFLRPSGYWEYREFTVPALSWMSRTDSVLCVKPATPYTSFPVWPFVTT